MNEKTTGFQDKLMKYMMPVANWVEKNNWLQAIKDGMIADIPVIIIGSIFLLPIALNNLIASGPIHDFISAHMGVLTYAAGLPMTCCRSSRHSSSPWRWQKGTESTIRRRV